MVVGICVCDAAAAGRYTIEPTFVERLEKREKSAGPRHLLRINQLLTATELACGDEVLHIRYHHVGQGEATSAVMPVLTRLTPPEDIAVATRIATALGVWRDGMSAAEAATATADALEAFYRSIGMPTSVHELDIPQDDLLLLARDTLKNFNANPGARPEGYVDEMLRLLQAAW